MSDTMTIENDSNETFHDRPQIDPWLAIQFASDHHHIDDHYDCRQFLCDVLENDMLTIADEWPEFVAFVASKKGKSIG